MSDEDLHKRIEALEREVLALRQASWRVLQVSISLASIQNSSDTSLHAEKMKKIEETMDWLVEFNDSEIGVFSDG